MASLDCNEYENLRRRRGGDYSPGHRVMYEMPIRLLSGKRRNILEAGFGIGWGLDKMIEAGIIEHYVGFEPNKDSFNYVASRVQQPGVELRHGGFVRQRPADHVFCIEVIEHVPPGGHAGFLADLRASTAKTLWMSTPDIRKHPSEGVRTCDEWKAMLKAAGFADVTLHREQWTVLFICQ
jgi:hypothetical protein